MKMRDFSRSSVEFPGPVAAWSAPMARGADLAPRPGAPRSRGLRRSMASALALAYGPHGSLLTAAHNNNCGSIALARLTRALRVEARAADRILSAVPPVAGFSVRELLELGRSNGVALEAVSLPAGAEIPAPSIVHWSYGHFSAILESQDGRCLVGDPLFGGRVWLPASRIRAGVDSVLLVPAGE